MKSFIAAADLKTQRKYAKQIEGILLRDTPVVFAYFYNYVAAGTSKVKGYQPEGSRSGSPRLRGMSRSPSGLPATAAGAPRGRRPPEP